jgi:hypothetical protein
MGGTGRPLAVPKALKAAVSPRDAVPGGSHRHRAAAPRRTGLSLPSLPEQRRAPFGDSSRLDEADSSPRRPAPTPSVRLVARPTWANAPT